MKKMKKITNLKSSLKTWWVESCARWSICDSWLIDLAKASIAKVTTVLVQESIIRNTNILHYNIDVYHYNTAISFSEIHVQVWGKVAASQSNCVGANTNNLTSKVEMRLSRGGPTRPVNLVCVHLLAEFISGDLPLALDGQIAWPVRTQASHIVCPELEK